MPATMTHRTTEGGRGSYVTDYVEGRATRVAVLGCSWIGDGFFAMVESQ